MVLARHKTNPFLEQMIVPVGKRKVSLSRLGKDNNILMNQGTGEVLGTHITTFKNVDSEQFIKLFTSNIAMAFDLTSAGIKVFSLLVWLVQHKALAKDEIDLDIYSLNEFVDAHADRKPALKLSATTFKRGINELEHAQVVAKTLRAGRYFINPNFVFNGDRLAFTTVIEKKKPSEHPSGDDKTQDLFADDSASDN
jgi:hypothetical protein